MSEEHKKSVTIGVPGAIIIGAIIIGLAIVLVFSPKESSPSNTERPTIIQAAKKVRVNQKDLEQCIADKTTEERVTRDMQNAQEIGFQGTPHSIIMNPTTGKKVSFSGALPKENWDKLIAEFDTDTVIPSDDDLAKNMLPLSSDDHMRGAKNPRLIIVEYSDIDCPFCIRLHSTLVDVLKEHDDIAWVYRHTPITGLHPEAYTKALATECVYTLSNNNHETFWKYLDMLLGV